MAQQPRATVQTLVRVRIRPRLHAKELHSRACLELRLSSDRQDEIAGSTGSDSSLVYLGPDGTAAGYEFDRVYGELDD